MRRARRGVEHAARHIARVLEAGVDALVLDLRPAADGPAVDGGDGRDHLIGRAGRIRQAERAVVERLVRIGGQLVIIRVVGGKVIGRVARAGEHLAGLDLHDDDGAALGVLAVAGGADAVFAQAEDLRGQRFLRDLLQAEVNGRFDVIACDGVDGVVLLEDVAVGGDGRHARAVRAVQLFLKGLLQPVLADIGIHGVALALVGLPIRAVHLADGAEDVGGERGVVLADARGLHVEAGDIQLRDGRKRQGVDVRHEHIGVQRADIAPQVQLIAQRDHAAALLLRPVGGQVVNFLEPADELRRGDVRVPAALGEERAEIAVPQGRAAFDIGIGLFLRDGEMVRVFQPQLAAQVHQAAEVLVRLVGAHEHLADDDEIVAGAVADEDVAVAVEDLAARGRHARVVRHGAAGRRVLLLCLRDLHIVQADGKHARHDGDEQHEHAHAEGKLMLIHGNLRFLRCI